MVIQNRFSLIVVDSTIVRLQEVLNKYELSPEGRTKMVNKISDLQKAKDFFLKKEKFWLA